MQQVWRKRWNLIRWVALGAVTLVVFVLAVFRKDRKVCNGVEVSFQSDGNNYFTDEKGVLAVLNESGQIKGVPMNKIDLAALEARLKKDRWIANADLFFDNRQNLQAVITEKEPVARIFTTAGSSFYIDSACRRLPLSARLSARIPMFTNFPSDNVRLSKPDSALLAEARSLAMFIGSDGFWKAQVSQIDVTPGGFEMVPTVGNHIVALGKEGPWDKKFDRLYSFYKQVWTRVGFERYERLDVQYDNQVIATVKGAKSATIDSAKALQAYQRVIAEVRAAADSTGGKGEDEPAKDDDPRGAAPTTNSSVKAKPAPPTTVKAKTKPSAKAPATLAAASGNRVPKALMPKRRKS